MNDVMLPPLREELSLHEGPRSKDGAPTWTIHDPPTNRFFLISWLEFEILKRWKMGVPANVLVAVNEQTALNIDSTHIDAMLKFLMQNSLISVRGEERIKHFSNINRKNRRRDVFWLLKNYLFLRIHLINPDRFLKATYPALQLFFSPKFRILLIFVLGAGLYLSIRQWDVFMTTMQRLFNFEGMIWYMTAIFFCKIIHEFGHAYTAHRYGCRVSSMGVMFLVMMPVLFTDTTEAWKVPNHYKRLKIAAAGMIAELSLATIALFCWCLLPDSPARIAAFMVATSAWIITLAINLNPFMKFDGYYIISDWFQIPNLQSRSFEFGKWWMREQIFGFKDNPPEICGKKQQYSMIFYAYGIWIYRFFLFIGIAILVYTLFAKILGIILFAVEMVYFVIFPIVREITTWLHLREKIHLNRHTVCSSFLLIAVLLLFFMPWASTVFLPATQKPIETTTVYTNLPGKVEAYLVENNQKVKAGQVLLELSSMDIDYQIAQILRRMQIVSWQLENQGLERNFRRNNMVLKSELAEESSKLFGLKEEKQKLLITAPFAGYVKEKSDVIQIGQTLPAREPILFLVAESGSVIEAFSPENMIKRIRVGMEVTFIPEIPEMDSVQGQIIKIDSTATQYLSNHYLASPLGGEIPAQFSQSKHIVPTRSIYRLKIGLTGAPEIPNQIIRGRIRLELEPESYASKTMRHIKALAIRESGF